MTNGNLSDKKTSVFQLAVHLNFKYIYFDVIQFYFFVANKKINFDSKDITNIHRAFFYCRLLVTAEFYLLIGYYFYVIFGMNESVPRKQGKKKKGKCICFN